MDKKVRAAVVKRSDGECEACCCFAGDNAQCDHFFGRAKAKESVDTCWMLCASCHNDKTANRPSSKEWLLRFDDHCRRNGYAESGERARTKIAVLEAKGFV